MREILFRGKRIDNGEWVEGYFWTNGIGNHFIKVIKDKDNNFVGNAITNDFEVNPETVAQHTGIEDANGKKIFEGDILEIYMQHYKQQKPYVIDDTHEFYSDYYQTDIYYAITNLKVIGNIHDNPELLEEEQK